MFAGPTLDRSLRYVALVAAAGMLGACAHVGQPRPLTTNEQLVASALSWAVRVPLPAPEYEVEVPPTYPRDAILAAAAAAEPTTCVVRVRLRSNDPRSWLYATEGPEDCWPRPGCDQVVD